MNRLLVALAAVFGAAFADCQEIPGLRVSMSGRTFVPAQGTVELRVLMSAEADTMLPSQLLSGVNLTVKCDDAPLAGIKEPGKGDAVPILAGTRIERVLTFPATRFLPEGNYLKLATVVVAWEGLAGTSCVFKVAPDTRNIDIADLDLVRTQVVLVTSLGDMRLSFRPDKAPRHVENFVKLCLQGFYDGTKFHRILHDFMIQGGCPYTKDDTKPELWGTGGPGYSLNAEFNDLRHLRGTLSMARLPSDVNTAGSGFFIMHQDKAHLDKHYTAFGNLEEGADTLDRIANVAVNAAEGSPTKGRPFAPVILYSAIVLPVKK
jgi:peptidyl-prolyl cis-trans isomerase B (cyclophilin B)